MDLKQMQQVRDNAVKRMVQLITQQDPRFYDQNDNRIVLKTTPFSMTKDRRQEFRDLQLDAQFQQNYRYLANTRSINLDHFKSNSPIYS